MKLDEWLTRLVAVPPGRPRGRYRRSMELPGVEEAVALRRRVAAQSERSNKQTGFA